MSIVLFDYEVWETLYDYNITDDSKIEGKSGLEN
jgi:hypothetical protein